MRIWVAIWTGSTIICRAIAAWIAGGVALKLTVITLGAAFAKGLPWTTNLVCLAAAAWLVTAIVLGLRHPVTVPPAAKTAPTPAPASAERPPAGAPQEPPVLTRDRLIRALHEVGAPHAHTSALAEHLKAPAEAVRQALDEARIPRSGGVRMKGRPVDVSPGVKKSDFPPLPSPSEETPQNSPVEGALTSNNNSNNTGTEPPAEGPTIVQDETNPNRWHILRSHT